GRHQPVDRGHLDDHRAQLRGERGYFRYCPTKSSTFVRSRRNTPPVPPHVPFSPNEVTPPITLLDPTKLGPPESPKQVPPVDALFESSSEKSPTMPPSIWIRCGSANMRIFSASILAGLMRWTP